MGLLYLCDRTEVVPEAQKVRDPVQFWAVWAVIVVAALFTIRKSKDAAPLSREQTDEWKGWMQIMFLMWLVCKRLDASGKVCRRGSRECLAVQRFS